MSIEQLKSRLRANDQLVSGTKGDLVKRIKDCVANGGLPRCPQCNGGRMKASGGGFQCAGFYDDDHFHFCRFFTTSAVRPAWQTAPGELV